MDRFDLDRFLDDCRVAVGEADRPAAIRSVLDRVSAQHATVADVLGPPARGSLTTLLHEPEVTVLHVVWTPGMRIEPHDHTMTAGIVVHAGREDNEWYRRRPDGHVERAGGARLSPGDVTMLGRDAVHAVEADPDRYTGALHVYAGDFFDRERGTWDAATGAPTQDERSVAELFEAAEAARQA